MNNTLGRVAACAGVTAVAIAVVATAVSMNSRRVTFGDMRAVYTRFVFHMPFENSQPLTKAIVVNATLTAMNTPVGPKPKGCARAHASGISHIHRHTRLMIVGVRVSP